ncbi:mitogen-activated protein kinase kinase kinase 2-like [Physella acuta]|uniref:mitogen-activated protein kinase kinase kinase 2-like n=1 Tax=Physella acuta TaxID=109671 RepID=UPI0027DBF904|nr:mitogen-activated protein kinase kinase kinase 2-like [Physella acuta]
MILTLDNIARRKDAKKLVSFQNLKHTLMELKFKDSYISLIAKMILLQIIEDSDTLLVTTDEIQTVIEYIKEACKVPDKRYKGFHRSELLQALAKFAKHPEAYQEIIPLLDTLNNVLDEEDLEELEHTTECLKEMSGNLEASQLILTNQDLTSRLVQLDNSGNSDIDQNINDIFWKGGRSTGILTTISGKVVSDEFPKHFEIETDDIGKGFFGSVHLVKDTQKPDERKFVAKKLKNLAQMAISLHEAEVLLKTKHPRIVQFHGFMKQDDTFIIFLEYLKHGTLATFVSRRGFLEETLTRQFTIQILDGVQYLHKNNIIHRDIKGNNILMVDESAVKLTDFGISEFMDDHVAATDVGTVRYIAPELITSDDGRITNYTSKADIWSVGCTVIEMLTGKPPNSSVPTPLAILRIANSEPLHYQLPPSSSVYLQEFLDKVLHREAKHRPTADWLLKNDAFVNEDYAIRL